MGGNASPFCRRWWIDVTSRWIYVILLSIALWTMLTSACTNMGVTVKSNFTYLYNPQKELVKCGRHGKASWICDPNKYLCDKEGDRIDELAKYVRGSTGCPCPGGCPTGQEGYKFAVAVVPKILDGGESDAVKEQIGLAWTQFYQNLTAVGHCGEDIVIVWSVADHTAWVLTGSTVQEKYLYTKCTSEILQQADDFKCAADPAKGVLYIMSEIRDVFEGRRCNFLDIAWVKFVLPTGIAIVLYMITLACYAYHLWNQKKLKLQRRRDGLA